MTDDVNEELKATTDRLQKEFDAFVLRCESAFQRLFNAARDRNEAYFAIALMPEFRGVQGAGWNTAEEAKAAFGQYLEHLQGLPASPIRIRLMLSFYSHISEAAGFYEVPKNMLLISEGECYNMTPFQHLADTHRRTGETILPNANKIMKNLLGHAKEAGFEDLCAVIIEAFDPDIRNAYAHGDYVVWGGDLHLTRRYGGYPRVIVHSEFLTRLNKAAGFFQVLWETHSKAIRSYAKPKHIWGRLNDDDVAMPMIISCSVELGSLTIQTGPNLHDEPRAD
jgi:hypothetical protein